MQDERPSGRVSGKSVAELLRGLRSADAGAAWVEFLDLYSEYLKSKDPETKTRLRDLARQIQKLDETFRFTMDQL